MIPTVVWGTGNVGRAAIRAVEAHPALTLAAVLVHDPAKVGRDAGELGGVGRTLGVAATDDIAAVLAARPRAVVYAASGDIRPDDALADIGRAIEYGAVVVTPSLYPLYDQRNAPPELRDPVLAAVAEGGGSSSSPGSTPAGAMTSCPCWSAASAPRWTSSAARRSSTTPRTSRRSRCAI